MNTLQEHAKLVTELGKLLHKILPLSQYSFSFFAACPVLLGSHMAAWLAPGPCETQTYHVHSSLDALETELFFSLPVCP